MCKKSENEKNREMKSVKKEVFVNVLSDEQEELEKQTSKELQQRVRATVSGPVAERLYPVRFPLEQFFNWLSRKPRS